MYFKISYGKMYAPLAVQEEVTFWKQILYAFASENWHCALMEEALIYLRSSRLFDLVGNQQYLGKVLYYLWY